jgi:hypothetical protein
MFFVQLYYYFGVFRRATALAKPIVKGGKKTQTPVSVVICATNECANLTKNLPLILAQDYPAFDVIVINDCSTDKTEDMLSALKIKHSNLYYSNVEFNEKFKHDRKLAITLGVKASQYNDIIFTDADCTPPDNQWLAAMQTMFVARPDFVIGHCNYPAASDLIRCDTIYTSLFAINAARKGAPFKVTFKNLGLNQKMFFAGKGFAHLNHYPNSEETLFVCRNATAEKTVVALAPETIMTSAQALTFKQWWQQRLVQASLFAISRRGQATRQVEMFSRVAYYLAEIALIALAAQSPDQRIWALTALAIVPVVLFRSLTQLAILQRVRRQWNERGIMFALFCYDRWSPILALCISLLRPNLNRHSKILK